MNFIGQPLAVWFPIPKSLGPTEGYSQKRSFWKHIDSQLSLLGFFCLGTEHVNKHTHVQPFYDEILANVITIKQHQTACTSHHEQSKQTIKNILQSCSSIHVPK